MLRLLIIAVLLTGCNGGGLLRGSGQEVPTPGQWERLCADQPQLEICKPDKKP
jgi:predicted small secreted protein